MPDTLELVPKPPLVKGPLQPPSARVKPPSYTENVRSKNEVTIMKQDWQSDPSTVPQPFVDPPSNFGR
ncbi:hypothetical protein J7T55_003240 [Diaporthe amygdali]|uniref:uncharacterized protein n=1 Tax=Phomopsis amygdali TaxID=1214568 RepID=UPI0022FE6F4C|nr:uncharacterized protein J7T55_003240 [Diaporthe amygdali]KAJ0122724.1 hypothetical protein J7T55_003240 [Diaporthe amygdali]